MSTSLSLSDDMLGDTQPLQKQTSSRFKWLLTLLFWVAVLALVVGAVLTRLYHLGVPFDRDSYDEGVYWQSLRAMLEGQSLYHNIFYSQPPMFLLSVYPGFAVFGGTLWSARFGIVLVCLLGFVGAGVLGKALTGRMGVLAALLLLLVDTFYLHQSQTIQAEGPSVAFTLLAIGFAFLWWQQPDGRRGICWATLAGLTLTLSIFAKLLAVSTLVPIAMLMLARIWQIWRKQPGTNAQSWLPILAGVGMAVLSTLAVVLPFAGSFQQFWAQVVTFHEVAAKVAPGTTSGNFRLMEPALFSLLSLAALYGTLTAFLRRDWRALPLLVWLLVTTYLLLRQYPLFYHHLVALEPPFIALAVLGVAKPASYQALFARVKLRKLAPIVTALGMLLILRASYTAFHKDLSAYRSADLTSTSSSVVFSEQVANDLRLAITSDQWVITDGQFVAALADRSTPPSLVDTSYVRIMANSVTTTQLEQTASNPRVHAVLFFTGRFGSSSSFHKWVSQNFHLLHNYGNGQELWVR
jgi:4-amino-4-deoxy-L-arabinose transferase-like glycosyltransferase